MEVKPGALLLFLWWTNAEHRPCSDSRFQTLLEELIPMLRRTISCLLLANIVLIAAVVPAASAPQRRHCGAAAIDGERQ